MWDKKSPKNFWIKNPKTVYHFGSIWFINPSNHNITTYHALHFWIPSKTNPTFLRKLLNNFKLFENNRWFLHLDWIWWFLNRWFPNLLKKNDFNFQKNEKRLAFKSITCGKFIAQYITLNRAYEDGQKENNLKFFHFFFFLVLKNLT